jgi:polyphosphate kinase
MKRNIIYGCLLFILSINMLQAQERRSKEERIHALKVAFITEELNLTPEQSQGFWPLYNELQKKLKELRKSRIKRLNLDDLSDAELETLLENHLKVEEEKVALNRAYVQKFKKVITIRQVLKLAQSEHRFRKELLQRAKERREGGGRRR